jgi:hypothetical protein
MQSLLVHLASIAVMVHMTFGCSLHHGIGSHACVNQCANMGCDHHDDAHSYQGDDSSHEHEHDEHQPLSDSEPVLTVGFDNQSHDHQHCHDDSCNVTQFVKFAFSSIDFNFQYLCVAENAALAGSQTGRAFSIDRLSDFKHTKPHLRAHLMLGVLTI